MKNHNNNMHTFFETHNKHWKWKLIVGTESHQSTVNIIPFIPLLSKIITCLSLKDWMLFADKTKLKDKQVIISESRGLKGILLIVDTCDSVSY